MHLGRFVGPAGDIRQRTETTGCQAAIFTAAGVAEPSRFLGLAPAEASVAST